MSGAPAQWWATAEAAIDGQSVEACEQLANQLLSQGQSLQQWLLAQLLLTPPISTSSLLAWRATLLALLLGQQLGWRPTVIRPLLLTTLSHGWHRQFPTAAHLQALGIRRRDWQLATLSCHQWRRAGDGHSNSNGALCGLSLHWARQLHYLLPESALARCWRELRRRIPFALWQVAAQVAAGSGAGLMVMVGKDPAMILAASEPPRLLLLGGDHKGKRASVASHLLRQPQRLPLPLHEPLLARFEPQPSGHDQMRNLLLPDWWPRLLSALGKGKSPAQLAPMIAQSLALCAKIGDTAQQLMRSDVSREPSLTELIARLGQLRLHQLIVAGVYLERLSQWPGPCRDLGEQLLWHYLQLFSLLADSTKLDRGHDGLLLAVCYAGSLMLHPRLAWGRPVNAVEDYCHPAQLLGIDDLPGLRRRSRYLAHRWHLSPALRPTLLLAGRASGNDPRQRLAALLQMTSVVQQRVLWPQIKPWPAALSHWLGVSSQTLDGFVARTDLPALPSLWPTVPDVR
ncbi:MAG: hypothetical protein II007_02665 [Gammaproteobacteria bacterium]|nr:hypothetical protein [Gammaproteobacteria bacterium]